MPYSTTCNFTKIFQKIKMLHTWSWSLSHFSKFKYSLLDASTAKSMTKGNKLVCNSTDNALRSCATSRILERRLCSESPSVTALPYHSAIALITTGFNWIVVECHACVNITPELGWLFRKIWNSPISKSRLKIKRENW